MRRRSALGTTCPIRSRTVVNLYTRVVSQPEVFVIFGAGNLGRRVAGIVSPVLFCDSNRKLWGSSINGIPVESPNKAVDLYPDATFIVAIWNPSSTEGMLDRIAYLKSLGAKRIIPFTELFEEHAERMLPNLLWEKRDYYAGHEDAIREARSLLNETSRQEFDRQLRLRQGEFDGQYIDPGVQYFPAEVRLSNEEVFIDCGAFDGDSISHFSRATGNRFQRIVAFEPDPVNLAALRHATDGDSRITIQPFAIGARKYTAHFTVAGLGSHLEEGGDFEVQVTTLDDALFDCVPTYIKFDIEGSELEALNGGEQTIRRHRPKLAVCAYHVPDHLWRIPLRLHELLPDAELSLRTYNADGFDCVCYSLPK